MEKWDDVKKEIKSISEEEKVWIDLLAQLVQAREDEGLTQRNMGDLMGYPQPSVAAFESLSNDRMPNVRTLIKYVNALGKTIKIE